MAADKQRVKSEASAVRIQAAKRRIEAMRLRLEGYTFRQIAHELGCSVQRACTIVNEEMAKLRTQQHELSENLFRLTNDRLESLLKVWWMKAQKGDLDATRMILAILERQTRLLGLDAPKKAATVQVTADVTALGEQELSARARMMGLDLGDDDGDARAEGQDRGGPAERRLPCREAVCGPAGERGGREADGGGGAGLRPESR